MTTLYHTLFVDRMYSLEHNNMTAAPVIKGNTSEFLPTGASLSISKWRLREIGVWADIVQIYHFVTYSRNRIRFEFLMTRLGDWKLFFLIDNNFIYHALSASQICRTFMFTYSNMTHAWEVIFEKA